MKTRILFVSASVCLLFSSIGYCQTVRPVKILRLNSAGDDLFGNSSAGAQVTLPACSLPDTDMDDVAVLTGILTCAEFGPAGTATGSFGPDIVTTTPGNPAGVNIAMLDATNGGMADSLCDIVPPMGAITFTVGSAFSEGNANLRYKVQSLDVPANEDDCEYTAEVTFDADLVLDLMNGANYNHLLTIDVLLFDDEMDLTEDLKISFSVTYNQIAPEFTIGELFNCSTELKDAVHGFEQMVNDTTEVSGDNYFYDTSLEDKKLEFRVKAGQVIEVQYGVSTSVTAQSFCPPGETTMGMYTFSSGLTLQVNDKVLLGDVNGDGMHNILDIADFTALISGGGYQVEADLNRDCAVNILDIDPFVEALTSVCD